MLELSWDGEWYRRGYYDDGAPLGSSQSTEGRIDSIPQSWAVLSGAVPPAFAERAMDAVRTHLVRRTSETILLLTPPFDRGEHDPGYIRAYVPGLRENGGQYSHAAIWVVMALAQLGKRRRSRRAVPHAQPGQPHAHGGRTRALQRRAVCDGRRRLRQQPAGRPRRLVMVHGRVRMDVPARPRKHPRAPPARADVRDRPLRPGGWDEYTITWRIGATRYEIPRRQSKETLPRRGRRERSMARPSIRTPSRSATMAGRMR